MRHYNNQKPFGTFKLLMEHKRGHKNSADADWGPSGRNL